MKLTITVFTAIFGLSLSAQVVKPIYKVPKKSNTNVAQTISASKQEKINLEDINEWLCPKTLLRGDREFDGHGPRVKCEVKIRLSENGKEIWADISLWAQETVQDWSTTEGSWSKKVYDVPYGKTINKILSETASRTQFVSQPAGFQFIIPGADVQAGLNNFLDGQTIARNVLNAHGVPKEFTDVVGAPLHLSQDIIKNLVGSYVDGNTVYTVPALEGTLVNFFHIVGDTGGNDISDDDNCNDDTRIEKIEFFPVLVEFK
ncbi:hypothetical protein OX283_013875 [Flavobacterium sp. SUN052]|uniref:hypothetical protein n=1 Tax=Flavobacterium sp. SUN052 TaxID=3002441 RepID=UPI00237E1603|nr:hypothetical protein [Flavobacterium sp. SUN052]MEC4005755.1 hypothetical protein [Flavobacterium sp. SUN052]